MNSQRNTIIERRFSEGASYDVIARELSVTRNVVAGHLRRKGIRRTPIPGSSFEDYIEDCYWPANRMKFVVSETLGEPNFDMADRTQRAGLYLFGCILVGPTAIDVATATGLGRDECRYFDGKARGLEIIIGEKIDYKPYYQGDGLETMLNFALDCMIVAGRLECKGSRGPERTYYVSDFS